MPQLIDLKPLYRGDDRNINLAFTDSNGAIDITDWKIYFTVKHHDTDSDADAAIKKDTSTHSDPTNGKSEIELTNGETGMLTPGKHVYDIQIKKADGTVKTIMKGKIKILQDVTERED